MAMPSRHNLWVICLHWLTFILVLTTVTVVFYADDLQDRGLHNRLMDTHRTLGVILLALALWRLLVRLLVTAPSLEAPSRLIAALGRLSHAGLYLLLLTASVSGWLMTNAAGKPVTLLSLELPRLVGRDRALAETLHDGHELLAYGFLALVVVHILAALWHQFVVKDDLMRRMSPFAASKKTH